MLPIPSTLEKTYPPRGPLQQFRLKETIAFTCFRCGLSKKSKLITVYYGNWQKCLCNGCYGRLLSLYEIKSGTGVESEKAAMLENLLIELVDNQAQRNAMALLRVSEKRANLLSAESLKFLATATYLAKQLGSMPQLEWSPAVIGLCKAAELEIVRYMVQPISQHVSSAELVNDTQDKDIGRVAAFCADPKKRTPELGSVAHFLQTVIHSQNRRQNSPLIRGFLNLAMQWTGSHWILSEDGLLRSLNKLTTEYRNRAAHIDELSNIDYSNCHELTIGSDGFIWKLILSVQVHGRGTV